MSMRALPSWVVRFSLCAVIGGAGVSIAFATQDSIELDPKSGYSVATNITTTTEIGPGQSMTLRDDVAFLPYLLCYVDSADSNKRKPATKAVLVITSLADGLSRQITFEQVGDYVQVSINDGTTTVRLNDFAHACRHLTPNRTCVGTGMPLELWGPVVYSEIKNNSVVIPPNKLQLQLKTAMGTCQ
jgi:hypothetical protein